MTLSNIDSVKFKPPSDVMVTDERLIVIFEIASMRAEDFKLSLAQKKLIVSGARQLPNIAEACYFQQVEIDTGEFLLEYNLPKPENNALDTANYQNGILTIELPFQRRKSVNVVRASQSE